MDLQAQLEAAGRQMHFLLTDRAEVVEPQLTVTEFGGTTGTDTVVARVCCMVETRKQDQSAGGAGAAFDKVNTLSTHRITMPLGTPVKAGHAIVVDGRRYEVVAVPEDTYQALLVVDVKRVD